MADEEEAGAAGAKAGAAEVAGKCCCWRNSAASEKIEVSRPLKR